MDFCEEINLLGARSKKLAQNLNSEEATKNALILPFIQLLGFDIFNPMEVVPEYQAEAGVKKDQRVDYALLKNGVPAILIEAKAYGERLGDEHADQLKRYFPFVQSAKIGILTNGHVYKFYTDLEQANVMDDQPYMEFDIENPAPELVSKIRDLRKDSFDENNAARIAEQLKYTGQFKLLLARQAEAPDDDFVRLFAQRVWGGNISQSVREKLSPLLKEAFKQFIEDRISARLKKAAEDEDKDSPSAENAPADQDPGNASAASAKDGIATTEDEILGHQIIQAIAAAVVDPERVVMRGNKSYCAVLLDDSNRKTIVRLYFKKGSRRADFQGVRKADPLVALEKVSDLYKHGAAVLEIISDYEQNKSKRSPREPEDGDSAS